MAGTTTGRGKSYRGFSLPWVLPLLPIRSQIPNTMSTPTVNLDVLRTLHRIHKQLTDLRTAASAGPRQVHAHEVGVKQREEELAKIREDQKTLRKTIDQKQLQMKTNEQKIKDLGTKLNMAATQQGISDPQGPDRRRQDGQQRAGRRDSRDDGPTRHLWPKIAEAENVLKATQDKLAAAKPKSSSRPP